MKWIVTNCVGCPVVAEGICQLQLGRLGDDALPDEYEVLVDGEGPPAWCPLWSGPFTLSLRDPDDYPRPDSDGGL